MNEIVNIVSYYTWALKLAFRQKKALIILIISTYSVVFFMTNAEIIISRHILNKVESSEFDFTYIAFFLGILLFVYINIDVGNVLYMIFYEKIRHTISETIFRKVLIYVNSLPVEFYDKSKNNEYIERIITASRYDLHNLISANMSFYSQVIQLIVFLIMIVVTYPILVLPMLLTSSIPFFYKINEAKEKSDLEYSLQDRKREESYLSTVMCDQNYIKELRLFGSYRKVLERWDKSYNTIDKERSRLFFRSQKRQLKISCINIVANSGIIVMLILLKYYVKINFSTMFFLYQCQLGLNMTVGWFSKIIPNSYDSVRRITEIKDIIEEALIKESSVEGNLYNSEQPLLLPGKEIGFKVLLSDVGYKYEETGFELNHINMEIVPNKIIALLGENGSGKTTLVKLILGLYSPQKGKITYCAGNVTKSAEDFFGCCFQDYANYHLSLRENIGLGNIDNISDSSKIKEYLVQNGCEGILDECNYDLENVLGKLFDNNGKELSTGQWQRLATSRAFFSEKPIIIFDEPSASLDAIAEFEQMRHIRNMIVDKTVILISHRVGFARLADEIYYMEAGSIIEKGSHDQLMKTKGKYHNLFMAQAAWYDWSNYEKRTKEREFVGKL